MNKKVTCAICMFTTIWISSICLVYAMPQPLEYFSFGSYEQGRRIEPNGSGTVYNVSFTLNRGFIGEQYAALEGKGIGKEQWPPDPSRENYIFVGWYDNIAGHGKPYTMNTPIYEDTTLYVKWKYSGLGGCWPRSHRGGIKGIEDNGWVSVNQEVYISADGYNLNLVEPKDQRFRWTPVSWRLSDSTGGDFPREAPFLASFSLSTQDEYKIYITYKEEIFDGVNWQETDQVLEVEELAFQAK